MPKVSPAPAISSVIDRGEPAKARAPSPFAALISGLNLGVKGAAVAIPGPDKAGRENEGSSEHAQTGAQDPPAEAQDKTVSAGVDTSVAAKSQESGSEQPNHKPPMPALDVGAEPTPHAADLSTKAVPTGVLPIAAAQDPAVPTERFALPTATAPTSEPVTAGAAPGTPASPQNSPESPHKQVTENSASDASRGGRARSPEVEQFQSRFSSELKSPATAAVSEEKTAQTGATNGPSQSHSRDSAQNSALPHAQTTPPFSPGSSAAQTPVAVNAAAANATLPGSAAASTQGPVRTGTGNAIGALGALSASNAKQAALNRLTANAPAIKQSVIQHAFIPQAAKGLAMALKQGEGTVTINLKPAHLGSLRVEVSMQASGVTAKIEASSETARQLLMDAQPSLRAALEARGLSVERIDITAVTAPPAGAPSQDASDQRPNYGGHQTDGNPGQHTGNGAEAHTGQGRDQPRRGDIEVAADPWPAAPVEVSFTLDQGGVYRLHLDAVA